MCTGEPKESRTCNTNDCPSFSDWTEWSSCSETCGGGNRNRERSCRLPNGNIVQDSDCGGVGDEIERCNEDITCPALGPWSEWSECSASCGGGERSRSRVCGGISYGQDESTNNPCQDTLLEREKCNEDQICPSFAPWSEWNECSQSCGSGIQSRSRECVPANFRLFCEGESVEDRRCNENPCPKWTEWSEWSECSSTCGGGVRNKKRSCNLPDGTKVEDNQCPGEPEMKESCNSNRCPELGPWSEWSECSATCGGGRQRRNRECGLPFRIGLPNPCLKPLEEDEECNTDPCPLLTEWSEWSSCSHTCGGGFRKKARDCVNPTSVFRAEEIDDTNPCRSSLEVIEECNGEKCPEWTSWNEWTECSRSCGGGTKKRSRQCIDEVTGEPGSCDGSDKDFEECNQTPCPEWSEWSEWSGCSTTCDLGTRTKVRVCKSNNDEGKGACEGSSTTSELCNQNEPCPFWSPWTEWTPCTATCGGGIEKRIRDCLLPDARNGNGTNIHNCDGFTWEMRECNTGGCPSWTEWTEFTKCSKSCGGGRRVRVRECTVPESLGNEILALFCPGDGKVIEDCNQDPCPRPTEWSEWSECSQSCGGGTRSKVRQCVNFRDPDGNRCNQDLETVEKCNVEPCPSWTEWTEWTPCTQTCGGGVRKKARECVVKERLLCDGDAELSEACNDEQCPSLTEWSEWTECTKTCGAGTKRRVRDCLVQDLFRNNGCNNDPLEEIEECNQNDCYDWTEWSDWSDCSAECGAGSRSKVRQCNNNAIERQSNTCTGENLISEDCNGPACPEWTDWSPWSPCSSSCGGGNQKRERNCQGGNSVCNGPSEEDQNCNTQECPQWSPWGDWSSCSGSCGKGEKTRSRSCPVENDDSASISPCGLGHTEEVGDCQPTTTTCAGDWSEWSEWSKCSQSCGGGKITRNRYCQSNGVDSTCEGPDTMMLFCNTQDCPDKSAWSEWEPWSECSATCGPYAVRQRERQCIQSRRNQRLGLFISPCRGSPQESEKCGIKECPENLVSQECSSYDLSVDEFKSFSGKPARNTADCTWDFFSCTKKLGKWPFNKPCCESRFDACCQRVMGHRNKKPTTTTTTTTRPSAPQPPSNGYLPPPTEEDKPFPNLPPAPPVDEQGNRIVLIDCIWNYMGCINQARKPESLCKEDFNTCSMIAMGMSPPQQTTPTSTRRPINDIDLPELPDFVENTSKRPSRPIQDIDLPQDQDVLTEGVGSDIEDNLLLNHPEGHESNEFLSCLLRLYQCQDNGSSQCANVERCKPEEEEKPISTGPPDKVTSPLLAEEPSEQDLGTEINVDCRWAYFACGRTRDETECRERFRLCSGGKEPDAEICADVAQNPQNYLVPHPEDCTKFYSCQNIGANGNKWLAHLMDCPESTGFDTELKICNFIKAIPRCQTKNERILRAYQEINTINAKQTREKSNEVDIDLGEVGYLTSETLNTNTTSDATHLYKSDLFITTVYLVTIVWSALIFVI